jgi:carboxyl-terminal processing protease
MRRRLLPVIAVAIIGSASVVGGYIERVMRPAPDEFGAQERVREDFTEAMSVIEANYAGLLNYEILGKSAMQGMLRPLDPHSAFFTKAEFDDLQTEQRSRFYGIGVTILRIEDRVYVMSASPEGPAHRAGLRYGDAIVGVDGRNSEDWSTDQVIQRVRGEKGEPVELTVSRPGVPPFTVRIVRGEVKLPSVRNAFMVGQNGIGYIALTGGFSKKTTEELTDAIDRLKQEGMRQLILDLRGNPGGLLDEAVRVAEKFLPAGTKIVEVRGREGLMKARTYEAPDDNSPEMVPMVVLIDSRSASASEVVSGALQDHDRAFIVGETSFGKGLVQTVYPLWGGTGLTLTTAKYYTPSGRSIQRDYSNVSFYDYHSNRSDAPVKSRGDALHTDLGRAVYGGGGITPDLEVKAPESNPARQRLFNALFDFVCHLVVGQVPGFREYRVWELQHKARLSAEDIDRYSVNDRLIAEFRRRTSEKPQYNLPDDRFHANLDYIR